MMRVHFPARSTSWQRCPMEQQEPEERKSERWEGEGNESWSVMELVTLMGNWGVECGGGKEASNTMVPLTEQN